MLHEAQNGVIEEEISSKEQAHRRGLVLLILNTMKCDPLVCEYALAKTGNVDHSRAIAFMIDKDEGKYAHPFLGVMTLSRESS